MKHLFGCCLVLASMSFSETLNAQGLAPRPRPGATPRPKDDKPAGPAEEAPKDDKDADEPELPEWPGWPGKEKKKVQFLQLKGYFRFRADLFQNMALGQTGTASARSPFFQPISAGSATFNCGARVNKPTPGGGSRGLDAGSCPDTTLAGANIRLRLEPTINVGEKIRIHTQIDVLDNLAMGSTPDGMAAGFERADIPLTAFADSQTPPVVGRNTNTPAIVVKRAWAEVTTPVGELSVGRMPWHWGLGMAANDGSCWDCNNGDNLDRVMFATTVFSHTFAVGYDFAASGPHSLNTGPGDGYLGQAYYFGSPIDLEQLDDVDQLFLVAGRVDKPEQIKERVERGELVLNYGTYFVFRKQDFAYSGTDTLNKPIADLQSRLLERQAWTVTPDLWFKLAWRNLQLEFEGLMVAGKIENVSDEDKSDPVDILQFGFVFRGRYAFLNKSLKVGLEVGFASGDQSELIDLNRRRLLTVNDPTFRDTSFKEFRFDPDYLVDLILFREIFGQVANAMYFKPSVQYDLFDSLGGRLDMIYSVAHEQVAYPGNSPHLGIELDLHLYYKVVEEGFYVGVQYGVLFPLAGLDRPAQIYGENQGAEIAQTLQANMSISF